MRAAEPTPLRVAIVHPDLGLGGAERLIVDAAVALSARGHAVRLYAASHEAERAFAETVDGSLDVRLRGRFLPRSLCGRAKVPLTALRTAYVAGQALREGPYDVVLTDVVAHILPVVRAVSTTPVVFYCHFPDLLLAPRRRLLYRLYRAPLDALERRSMRLADRVLVNSEFTRREVERVFPGLSPPPAVLYPPVAAPAEVPAPPAAEGEIVLLSLGRYEAKKGIELALHTLARLREQLPEALFARLRFIHAGSLSRTTPTALDTFARLDRLRRALGLEAQASLQTDFSDAERAQLLARARAVVYTPRNEHLGIVPLEAMAAARPVLAPESGGPLETIVDGQTGSLREPTPEAFAAALEPWIRDPARAAALGRAGYARVRDRFSREAFGAALEAELRAASSA